MEKKFSAGKTTMVLLGFVALFVVYIVIQNHINQKEEDAQTAAQIKASNAAIDQIARQATNAP